MIAALELVRTTFLTDDFAAARSTRRVPSTAVEITDSSVIIGNGLATCKTYVQSVVALKKYHRIIGNENDE